MDSALPRGVVTFLLTDVEASTRIWRRSPRAAALMKRQSELIIAAIERHGGVRPADQGEGDSLLGVFARPGAALAAALDAQRALATEPWPEDQVVRVRMAVHTGEAELRDEHNYGGLALIRTARLRALARGGQVLVSNATVALVGERLPEEGMSFTALGTVALAGLTQPERVSQLCHPELPSVTAELRRCASLPTWPTPLVGREQERRDVAALLAESAIVTISGVGGSGKTRLAHAVAMDLAERFTDGVAWVELGQLSSEEMVAGAALAACGVRGAADASQLDVLVHALARREFLIALDNCEHLLGACAGLAEGVARAGAGVRVLATSREPLGVTGETSWRIPSLGLPQPHESDLDHIASGDAVRLFVARARAGRPEFRLDATSAPIVAHVCRRLDGIPLALELAAARVRSLSLERVAAGLDDRFRLLTGGARTATARQRTLLASVEWSHDLLDEEERTLFRRLAVFVAPFDLEAAEAVAADEELDRLGIFDVLGRLVDKSLVQHVGDHYRMLETMRQYALERADDAGELTELRDRHLAWFRRRASAWNLGDPTRTVLDEVAAAVPDLMAALDWSLGGSGVALELLSPLDWHFALRDALGDLRLVARRVLGALPTGSRAWLDALAQFADSLVVARDIDWLPTARRALDDSKNDLSADTRGLVEYALGLSAIFRGRSEGFAALRAAVPRPRKMRGEERNLMRRFNLRPNQNREFELRGVNHLALVCRDMARTVDFYSGVLGMPLVAAFDLADGAGQHFFFDIGGGDLLAFFWFPGGREAAPGIASPRRDWLSSSAGLITADASMNHVAFDVPAERIDEYRERLAAKGVEVTVVVNHDPDAPTQMTPEPDDATLARSIYFFDPDGILLEFASWTRELPERPLARPATVADRGRYLALQRAVLTS